MPRLPTTKETLIGSTIVAVGGLAIWYFFLRCKNKDKLALYASLMKNGCADSHALSSWGGTKPCRGSKIMNTYKPAGTELEQVGAISTRMFQVASEDWTWKGALGVRVLSEGTAFLDSKANSGECATLAFGLKILILAPKPYGLGLGGGFANADEHDCPVKVETYEGANGLGFFANHQGTPLGVSANVYSPQGQQRNYYYWDNHKVVGYTYTDQSNHTTTTKYFDPNYGTSQGDGAYDHLADMAAYQATQIVQINPADFGNLLVSSLIKMETATGELLGVYIQCIEYDNGHRISAPLPQLNLEDFPSDAAYTQAYMDQKLKQRTFVIGPLTSAQGFDFEDGHISLADIDHDTANPFLANFRILG